MRAGNSSPGPYVSRRRAVVAAAVIAALAVAIGSMAWFTRGGGSAADAREARDLHLSALVDAQSALSRDLTAATAMLVDLSTHLDGDPVLTALEDQVDDVSTFGLFYPEPLWAYSDDETEALRLQTDDILSQTERVESGHAALVDAIESTRGPDPVR